jgi:hypothetical protein
MVVVVVVAAADVVDAAALFADAVDVEVMFHFERQRLPSCRMTMYQQYENEMPEKFVECGCARSCRSGKRKR